MISAWVFVRHGATASNDPENERFRSYSNVPLSEEGHSQAKKMGEKLANLPVRELWASPIHRTCQTAQTISSIIKVPFKKANGARDWNTGFLIGQLVKPNIPIIEYFFEHKNIPVPKGEAYAKFYKAWKAHVLDRLARLKDKPEGYVGVDVTHNRNLCALPHILGKGEISPTSSPIDPGGAYVVYLKGEEIHLKVVNL